MKISTEQNVCPICKKEIFLGNRIFLSMEFSNSFLNKTNFLLDDSLCNNCFSFVQPILKMVIAQIKALGGGRTITVINDEELGALFNKVKNIESNIYHIVTDINADKQNNK